MGAVSILEDLLERVDDIKHELQSTANEFTSLSASTLTLDHQYRHQATDILARAEKLSASVHALLDLATDPSVDLAQQVHELRQVRDRLTEEKSQMNIDFTRAKDYLQEQNASLNLKFQQEIERRKKAEQELRRLERQLGTDSKMFENYLDRNVTDQHIEQAKPGELRRGRGRR